MGVLYVLALPDVGQLFVDLDFGSVLLLGELRWLLSHRATSRLLSSLVKSPLSMNSTLLCPADVHTKTQCSRSRYRRKSKTSSRRSRVRLDLRWTSDPFRSTMTSSGFFWDWVEVGCRSARDIFSWAVDPMRRSSKEDFPSIRAPFGGSINRAQGIERQRLVLVGEHGCISVLL